MSGLLVTLALFFVRRKRRQCFTDCQIAEVYRSPPQPDPRPRMTPHLQRKRTGNSACSAAELVEGTRTSIKDPKAAMVKHLGYEPVKSQISRSSESAPRKGCQCDLGPGPPSFRAVFQSLVLSSLHESPGPFGKHHAMLLRRRQATPRLWPQLPALLLSPSNEQPNA